MPAVSIVPLPRLPFLADAALRFALPRMPSSEWALHERHLFGSSATLLLPEHFVDASSFRQVPDHQEVFIDTHPTDASLIIELLELDHALSHAHLASDHFNILATDNQATNVHVLSEQQLVNEASPVLAKLSDAFGFLLVGEQSISKFKSEHQNDTVPILILLAVLRLPSVPSDILLTFNLPKKAILETRLNLDFLTRLFLKIVNSFNIIDMSLFASP